jgi:hypothetical protein
VSRTSSAQRDTLVFFELGGREAVCGVPPRTVRRPGECFTLFVDAARLHFFDRSASGRFAPLRAPGALLATARL